MEVPASASPRPNLAWRPMYSILGDERLARLVTDGSDRAFAPLYERYHQQLYRYCRSIVHDDSDAQDALQSTFASALAALRRGQRDAPLRPWLFRIAHNEAVSVIRRRRPEVQLSEASERSTESVEDVAGERARFALLMQDLLDLPSRQRSALVMRELSGLSHEEIAIALRTSVGGAKQTIFEARRSLAELAEGRSMTCEGVRRMISDADGRTLRSRRVRAHLSACGACAEFAAAIPARSAELRALSPALPATAAAALFARAFGAGSGHGGGGAAGVAAGTAGKTASATLAAKALAGVAIVATTAGATAGLKQITAGSRHPSAANVASPAPAAAPTRVAVAATPQRGGRGHGQSAGHLGRAQTHRGAHRPRATGRRAPVARLPGVGSAPTTGGTGSASSTVTASAPAPTAGAQQYGGAPSSSTPVQAPGSQAPSSGNPKTQGGGHGGPGGGGRPGATALGGSGGGASVSVPGGSATVSVPGGSATVSVPGGSAKVSVPGGSATVSVPGGSAKVSVPGGSATVSVPGGSATLSAPGTAPLSVPRMGSVSQLLGHGPAQPVPPVQNR